MNTYLRILLWAVAFSIYLSYLILIIIWIYVAQIDAADLVRVLLSLAMMDQLWRISDRLFDIIFKLRGKYGRAVFLFVLWFIRNFVFSVVGEVVWIICVRINATCLWTFFYFKIKFGQDFVLAAYKMLDDIHHWESVIWVLLEMQHRLIRYEIWLENFLI